MHDAYLLETWDHTTSIVAQLYNIAGIVCALGGGKRSRPKSPWEFHPYRKRPRSGMRVDNIGVLYSFANALAKSK